MNIQEEMRSKNNHLINVNQKNKKDINPTNLFGVARFPEWLDEYCKQFDDFFIQLCQHYTPCHVVLLCKFFTGLFRIELGTSVVLFLFIIGEDDVAERFNVFIFLSIFIPILPRRFVYRKRPGIGPSPRSKRFTKEITTGFPSKTCALSVVYSYMVGILIFHYGEDYSFISDGAYLYTPIFLFIAVIITSYARVLLGSCYASDCVVGTVVGILIIPTSEAVYAILRPLCGSPPDCYSIRYPMTLDNLKYLNITLIVGLSIASLMIGIFLTLPPIRIFKSYHYVLGTCLGCSCFSFCFLCRYLSTNGESSLLPPNRPAPWYVFIFGVVVPFGFIFLDMSWKIIKNRCLKISSSLVLFCFSYTIVFGGLSFWRMLSSQQQD